MGTTSGESRENIRESRSARNEVMQKLDLQLAWCKMMERIDKYFR